MAVKGPIALALSLSPKWSDPKRPKLSPIGEIVAAECAKFQVEPTIIGSIIWQESKGNKYAIKWEKKFWEEKLVPRIRHDLAGHVPSPIPDLDTEKCDRAHSWGAMQVLGETARVLGFSGDYFPELAENEVNIHYGCMYFSHCMLRAAKEIDAGTSRPGFDVFQQACMHYNGAAAYALVITSHMEAKLYEKVLYA